jgi:hypothetical protein
MDNQMGLDTKLSIAAQRKYYSNPNTAFEAETLSYQLEF